MFKDVINSQKIKFVSPMDRKKEGGSRREVLPRFDKKLSDIIDT